MKWIVVNWQTSHQIFALQCHHSTSFFFAREVFERLNSTFPFIACMSPFTCALMHPTRATLSESEGYCQTFDHTWKLDLLWVLLYCQCNKFHVVLMSPYNFPVFIAVLKLHTDKEAVTVSSSCSLVHDLNVEKVRSSLNSARMMTLVTVLMF